MIGSTITRNDGVRFTVTGHHEGDFILSPADAFGSPEAVAYATLLTDFDLTPEDVAVPPSEQDVLRAQDERANRTINQTYGRAVAGDARPPGPFTPPEGSPEAAFAKVAEGDA